MTTMKTVALSFAAGIFGGTLAVVALSPLQAQQQPTQPAPAELRAQSFVLVNPGGEPAGLFGFSKSGSPIIQLRDKRGELSWQAPPQMIIGVPLSQR